MDMNEYFPGFTLAPEEEEILKKRVLELRKSKDELFDKILQEEALRFLQTADEEFFNEYFTGGLDEDGYLTDMLGHKYLPIEFINAGLLRVYKRSLERYNIEKEENLTRGAEPK